MDIGDEAPAQPRLHPILHPLEVGRRLVGRDDDLAVLVDQGIEGMKEFLLRRILARDELDVVDHQDIDGAELILEVHRALEA